MIVNKKKYGVGVFDKRILEIFQQNPDAEFTTDDIHNRIPDLDRTKIQKVLARMSNYTNLIEKTGNKKIGVRGIPNSLYKLNRYSNENHN